MPILSDVNDVPITPLIAFAGRARSGKDTAALHLLRHYNFEMYSFAAPIKRALVAMFDFNFDRIEGALKEEEIAWLGKSPRQLMQTLGVEWGRNMVCDDIWIKTLEQDIRSDQRLIKQAWGGAVISDVRTHAEAQWVRQKGGTVVHLSRTAAMAVASGTHKTEAPILQYETDLVVVNNGSLLEFENKLDGLMKALGMNTGTFIANG